MAAVTLTTLRRLATLHDKRVPGAREQLQAMAEEEAKAICELLGLPVAALTPDRIIRRIKDLTFRAKSEAKRKARERCEELAKRVAFEAQLQPDGSWKIPIGPLSELALSGGFAHAALEPLGVVDLRVLKRVLKSCRAVKLLGIEVTRTHLALTYQGPASRGRIALVVRPPERLDDAVTVRLGTRPVQATRRRSAGFLDHLQQALQEMVG